MNSEAQMHQSVHNLELDIAVIKEKVGAIEDIRSEVKKISDNYLIMQGNLSAYTDLKNRLEKVEKKMYILAGASVVIGTIAGFLLDKIF